MIKLHINILLVLFFSILNFNVHAFPGQYVLNAELNKYGEYSPYSYSAYDGISKQTLEKMKSLLNKKLHRIEKWEKQLLLEEKQILQIHSNTTEEFSERIHPILMNRENIKKLKRSYQIIRTDLVILIAREERRQKMI